MSATLPSRAAAVRRPRRRLRFTRDEELVRLVRAGDERAFEAIYDRHHRGILSFCRHMLGSAEEAEDAVQHTFLSAHRDIVTSVKPIQLKAWLYTIARNRCLSFLRARRDERALEDVPEPAVEGLAVQVQRRQDLRDMLADLQRLPDDQRAALVLAELGALSHEEIGMALGVRRDKVKALVFQARESLATSRKARDADCREIQEQLAVLSGGSLRRAHLKRHLDVCPACREFRAEVQRQRRAMSCVLPVAPSIALKEAVVGGAAAAGGGGIGGGGLLAASSGKALVAKVAAIALVAGGATGGGLKVVDEISSGGDGHTATAMAGIPDEQRAVRFVGALRDRAARTARERAADQRAARRAATPPPGDHAATGAGKLHTITVADRHRHGHDRKRHGKETVEAQAPPVQQAPTTVPPQPVQTAPPPSPPPVQAPPATVVTPAHAKKPDKPRHPKRPKHDPPAVVVPADEPRPERDEDEHEHPERGHGGGRGHWRSRGKGHRNHPGDPQPQLPPLPSPGGDDAPLPLPGVDRDDDHGWDPRGDHRGWRHGHDRGDDRGRGHGRRR